MTGLANVDGFKISIQDCVLLGFQPLSVKERDCDSDVFSRTSLYLHI